LATPLTGASVSPRFRVDIDAEPPPPQEPSNRAQTDSAEVVPKADDLSIQILLGCAASMVHVPVAGMVSPFVDGPCP